ncbi:MAG TPA: CoA ester lyase [Ramlibacter sp.]|nr:CoA ester lyase [Ramlibacter sp.]
MMIRSLFFAPANRPELVVKFPRFAADCSVIDLEDGTPHDEKAQARERLADTVSRVRAAGLQGKLVVRVNEPASPHYLDDLAAAFASDVDGIVIPKLEDPKQAFPAAHWIGRLDGTAPRAQRRFIVGGLESVRGVLKAAEVCELTPHLAAVYFGAEDFTAEMGARRTREGAEVATARAMVVMAARAARLVAIDQAVVDIRDDALYRADAAVGRDLGYQGKICVAPAQVVLAHGAYAPSVEERTYAQRLVAAYESASARGIGTIDFEGRMVDGPLLKRALAVLAMPAA